MSHSRDLRVLVMWRLRCRTAIGLTKRDVLGFDRLELVATEWQVERSRGRSPQQQDVKGGAMVAVAEARTGHIHRSPGFVDAARRLRTVAR